MEEGDNIILESRKKESMIKRIFNSKRTVTVAMIIIILIIGFLMWTSVIDRYEGCKSWECFNAHLAACEEARFAGGKEVIFGYIIHGLENDECVVDVEFLQGEIQNRDARRLIGEKMTCNLPQGIIMLPESDLERCNGPLKEKLQEQIIEQLHNFIVQNVGQINRELLNPLNYQ